MGPWLDARTNPRLVRGLTIGLGSATIVIASWLGVRSCSAAPRIEPAPISPIDESAPPDSTTDSSLPRDCESLASLAAEGDSDAVALAWLCPAYPLNEVMARATLRAVRTPSEALHLAPRLHDHPSLWGLARLVGQDLVTPAAVTLPDPARAMVSPIDHRVLAQVQRAHTVVASAGVTLADRTSARALLAKVYLQATQQLGIDVGRPPGPFARLLAGRALHYGRLFCQSYWRSRVAGLAELFAEVETRLLVLVVALESSDYHADAARLAVELDQTRRYLQRPGPRSRIEQRRATRQAPPWGVERLLPLINAVDRMLAMGLVDQAIDQVLVRASEPGGPGRRAMEQWLRDALVAAEREESLARLEQRLHHRSPDLAEPGTGSIDHAAEVPWPGADRMADQATEWIERAEASAGFARHYAWVRAWLVVRDRPDGLLALLDRANDPGASLALRSARVWLLDELVSRDDGRYAWLRRRAEAERDLDPAVHEAVRRRRFAAAVRDDNLGPQGPRR